MNLIQLQKGSKAFATKILFNEASFAVNEEEHIGVIGPNGAGKTTLFKILTGQETLDGGEVIKAKSLRLGYLAQHDNWQANESVEDYLSRDCITPLWKLKSLARNLGLTDEIFAKSITSLSGGYRMRCKLLYLIGQEPNLMLLDEPTNYLDLETTLVLENFLQAYKGAFLLISHDREFLRRTTDHVVEVEQGDITKYNGNIDDYFEQKTLLRTQLESRALSLQEKRNEVLAFVARFGAKASKAKQAQSRLKSLDRMESIELKALPVTAAIKLPPPTHAGKSIITMTNVNLGYGEKTVLKKIDFTLLNGDHLAVVGLNGAGKSTFLKALAQRLEPQTGSIALGYQVSIAYYAQHVAESLDAKKTVIEEMTAKAHPEVSRQEGLNMAGSLLFSGDDIHKKISVLSGGEKSRVALGQILLQKAPCLILDEPTNHLDFQTVEALTQALTSYEGTLVVVSHDRSFVRRVGKKIVEINNGKASIYPGSYDEYIWSLEKGILSERADNSATLNQVRSPGESSKKSSSENSLENSKESRKEIEQKKRLLEKTIERTEKKLANQQQKLEELNLVLASGLSSEDLQDKLVELQKLQAEIEGLEKEWIQSNEELESLKNPLTNTN